MEQELRELSEYIARSMKERDENIAYLNSESCKEEHPADYIHDCLTAEKAIKEELTYLIDHLPEKMKDWYCNELEQ